MIKFSLSLKKDYDLYSRFIIALKAGLPIIACSLLVMSFSFSKSKPSQKAHKPIFMNEDISIVDLKYSRQNDRLPFSIEATSATENDQDQFVIENLQAQATFNENKAVHLKSRKGILDKATQKLNLKEGVHLTYNDDVEFFTPEVQFNLESGAAESHHSVEGTGPFGKIKSQGLKVSEDGKNFYFTGKSQIQLKLPTR